MKKIRIGSGFLHDHPQGRDKPVQRLNRLGFRRLDQERLFVLSGKYIVGGWKP